MTNLSIRNIKEPVLLHYYNDLWLPEQQHQFRLVQSSKCDILKGT